MITQSDNYGTYGNPYVGESASQKPWGSVKETGLVQWSTSFLGEIPLLSSPGTFFEYGLDYLPEECKRKYSLCDREIAITFKRAWGMSNFWNKAKLIGTLISTVFDKEEFSYNGHAFEPKVTVYLDKVSGKVLEENWGVSFGINCIF